MENALDISTTTATKLLGLKCQFEQLLFYNIDGLEIIARPLYVSESEAIISLSEKISDDTIQEWIVSNCVLYTNKGDNYLLEEAPAGLVEVIAESILDKSSMPEDKFLDLLLKYRNSIVPVKDTIESVIMSVFKQLSVKDIRNMSQKTQIEYIAKAESIVGRELLKVGGGRKGGRKSPIVPQGFTSVGVDPRSEAARILSKEAADVPDIEAEKRQLMDL